MIFLSSNKLINYLVTKEHQNDPNNSRLVRNMVINFVIFNKKTLNLFNLDIGLVLSFFLVFNLLKYKYYFKLIFILVYSVKMFDFLVFSGKNQKLILFIYFDVMNFR